MTLELQPFSWILGKLEVPLGIFNYSVLLAIKTVLWSFDHRVFPPPIPFLRSSLQFTGVTKALTPPRPRQRQGEKARTQDCALRPWTP